MRVSNNVALVGSGDIPGFGMTDPLDCHIYLIDGGDELALIDAGVGQAVDELLAEIRFSGYAPGRVRYLFLTHAHFDHAGGARALRDEFGLQVVASARTARMVEAGDVEGTAFRLAQEGGIYPAGLEYAPCPVDIIVEDGDLIRVGEREVKALATPGHSGDHFAYLLNEDRAVLFSGDSVLAGGRIILQNIPDCVLADYVRTIRTLAALAVSALLPGHGRIALRRGQRHLEMAVEVLDRLQIPPNLAI